MKLSLFKLKILLYHGYCILSFIYHKVFWVNYGNIFGVLHVPFVDISTQNKGFLLGHHNPSVLKYKDILPDLIRF